MSFSSTYTNISLKVIDSLKHKISCDKGPFRVCVILIDLFTLVFVCLYLYIRINKCQYTFEFNRSHQLVIVNSEDDVIIMYVDMIYIFALLHVSLIIMISENKPNLHCR